MLSSLIEPGRRWTLVIGKGGVGKTTTAAALATELADGGGEVLLMSTDPAHSVGDVFGQRLDGTWRSIEGVARLRALEVDPEVQRAAFFERHRADLRDILDRGTYLDREEVESLLDLALPGMDEMASLLTWLDILRGEAPPHDRLVVDTAPTGHTLRLLDAPRLTSEWLDALSAMERKHDVVAAALSGGRYRGDDAARFVTDTMAAVEELGARLRDTSWTRAVLVNTPDAVVGAETGRTLRRLRDQQIPVGGMVVNRADASVACEAAADVPHALVPRLDEEPVGPDGVRAFAAAARGPAVTRGPGRAAAAPSPEVRQGHRYLPPTDRQLYLVVGKGGVGKTTVAASLALFLAAEGRGARLVSVDPAGSLGEVLGTEDPSPAPGLEVRQLDAAGSWAAFRERYRNEVEEVFDRIAGGGASLGMDREIIGKLMRLAPPGIDEVVALTELAEMRQDAGMPIVLDTAPTGHLLRLIESQEVVRNWIRAILRLLLRYREVTGLGRVGEALLEVAREIREFSEMLVDPERTAAFVVLLPEALSLPETRRLLESLRSAAVPVERCLLNRGVPASTEQVERALRVATEGGADLVILPDCGRPPVGSDALNAFRDGWRHIDSAA